MGSFVRRTMGLALRALCDSRRDLVGVVAVYTGPCLPLCPIWGTTSFLGGEGSDIEEVW